MKLIKVLHTYKGVEYYYPVHFEYIVMIHQSMTPYTPQQNGVVERKNETLKKCLIPCYPKKRVKMPLYELGIKGIKFELSYSLW